MPATPARPGSASRSQGRSLSPRGPVRPPPARPVPPLRSKPWGRVRRSCHSPRLSALRSPAGSLHRLLTVIEANEPGMAVTIRVHAITRCQLRVRARLPGKDSRHVKNAPVPPARRIMTRLGLIPVAGLLATAAPVQAQAVTVARAAVTTAGAAHSGRVSSLCRRYQHFAVATAEGSHFVVKNDNYGGQRECLAVRGERPNFTVTQSQLPIWHAKPQAYPFILRGCSWGTCSAPDSDLPKQVSALRRP